MSRVNGSRACLIKLANGSVILPSLNSNGIIYTDWLFYVDVNGAKEPNMLGRDVFLFKFIFHQDKIS